jgi:hypothetical protein
MTTTEKQIWQDTFNELFKEVRFKKEKNAIYVFNGKSLRKKIRNKPKSSEVSLPNVIMTYFGLGNSLEIRREVYKKFVGVSPEFESNPSFLFFFKEWFENKFNMNSNRVYVDSRSIMIDMESK